MNHSWIFTGLLIALGATLAALGFGLLALFKGGEFNRKYGNQAMQWRVLLQMVAILLFTLMLISGK